MERKLKIRNLLMTLILFFLLISGSTAQGAGCLISGENVLPLGTTTQYCVDNVPSNASNKKWTTYGSLSVVTSNSNCITVSSTSCGTSLIEFTYCTPVDVFTTHDEEVPSDGATECCGRCIFEINTPIADCCSSDVCCVPIVEGAHACKPNGNCGGYCPTSGSGNDCGDGFFVIAFPEDCVPTNIESFDIVMSAGSVFQSGPQAGQSYAYGITPSQIWWNLGSGIIHICSDACYDQTIDVEVTIRYTDGCHDVEVLGQIEGGCLCDENFNDNDPGNINLKLSPNPLNGSKVNINADGHFHNNMELRIIDFNSSQVIYRQDYKNKNVDNISSEYDVPTKYSQSTLVVQILINGEVRESQILLPGK